MIYTLYLLSLIISAVVASALAFYFWKRRSMSGATPAIWLMLAVAVWSLGYVLQFTSTQLSGQIFATNIQYLGIVTVPVAWFAFSLQYTGHDNWLTRRNLFLLAIVPFVTVVLAWTNSFHGLMWQGRHLETSGSFIMIAKTYGLWFWVHTSYCYLLILLGTFILVRRLFRHPRLFREQAVTLLICATIPLVWNVLYVFHLAPIYRVDLTPSAFTVSGLAMAFGLFRFRLLDIAPMARDAIVEGMSDGVIVLDTQNRCVDLNPAAQLIIGCPSSEAIGQPVARVLSGQPELVELLYGVTEARVEIVVKKGKTQRYYETRISPLRDRRSRFTGRLVILCDITERRRAEEELKESERRYRLLAENAKDVIWTVDMNMRPTYMSPSITHLLGYSVEEAMAKPMEAVYTPASFETAMKVLTEELATENMEQKDLSRSRMLELELYRKDGSIVPIEGKFTFIRGPDKRPVEILVMARDITERKRAEGELLAYQKELRSLASELSLAEERERRRIATEVHDHVSQNLAFCRMKLGSLIEAARSTRFAKPLSEIQTLIKRLIDEVRSLTFEVSSPLLYELGLEAAVERLTEQIGKEHGVKFNFEDDGQPKPLDNDIRVLLFQTVRELLINITKHAQARYARVRMERHGGNLRITVLDDGVGFDTSQISPGSKRIKGFGLFSIRERLHQIGGHIDIESEQGQGTQVTLTASLKQT